MERSQNCAECGEAGMPTREARPWPEELSDVDIDVPIVRLGGVLYDVTRVDVFEGYKKDLTLYCKKK